MSSEAKKLEHDQVTLSEFDDIFFNILSGLGKDAVDSAAQCTGAIFNLSSNYVDRPAFEALKKFYDLYFSEESIDASKDTVNEEVDNLIDAIQEKLDAGEDAYEIEEDEETKKSRLAMAGVQKQVEGLITINAGIKKQIIPALSSMQFEDAVSQRMEHLLDGWKKINEFIHNSALLDAEPFVRELANICTSVEETESFYQIMLDEKPPEGGQAERSVFLEF